MGGSLNAPDEEEDSSILALLGEEFFAHRGGSIDFKSGVSANVGVLAILERRIFYRRYSWRIGAIKYKRPTCLREWSIVVDPRGLARAPPFYSDTNVSN